MDFPENTERMMEDISTNPLGPLPYSWSTHEHHGEINQQETAPRAPKAGGPIQKLHAMHGQYRVQSETKKERDWGNKKKARGHLGGTTDFLSSPLLA
jgi:hypothetical protein